VKFGGFWWRALAFIIDSVPITIGVAAIAYVFFGFDEVLQKFLASSGNVEARAEFLPMRNVVRDLSFLVWIVYCAALEASPLQATIGKKAVGLRVVGLDGQPISFARSAVRNTSKILSYLPLGLGFVWAGFSKEKQSWHDKIAGTYVVVSGADLAQRMESEPHDTPI
jgi:uncharacterized RDD family membrane protein YckC